MTEPTEAMLLRAMAYADKWHGGNTVRYRNQVAAAWLRGYYGEQNQYPMKRGGNFAAGLRSAYNAGERLAENVREGVGSAPPAGEE